MTHAEETQIRELAAQGTSQREIARLVNKSRPTIAKVLRAPAPLPGHMAIPTPVEPADAPADDAPALEQVRFLMAEAREQLRNASVVGDANLAQRHTRNAAFLANALAKLERAEAADAGVAVKLTREEAARIEESLRDRIAALCNRPLMCAECSRALSVQWGTGSSKNASSVEGQ